MAYILIFYLSYFYQLLVLHMQLDPEQKNLKVRISILYLAKMIVLIL
jgi:hypothetical protein